MSVKQKWIFAALCVLCVAIGLTAQMQQSGGAGSTVSVSNFPATQPVSATQLPVALDGSGYLKTHEQGTANVSVQNASLAVTGTFWQATQPVSGTVTVNALPASSNVIGKTAPNTACGTAAFSQAWSAIPTVSTAITASTTCVVAIMFTNTNGTAQTVTVTDNQGSPVTVVNALSIPGNSQVTFPLYGAQLTSGIKWSAGGAGVTGAAVGVQ